MTKCRAGSLLAGLVEHAHAQRHAIECSVFYCLDMQLFITGEPGGREPRRIRAGGGREAGGGGTG